MSPSMVSLALLLTACSDTPADGDSGGDGASVDPDAPTWHQDLAPVVAERCGSCHTAGGVAPFELDDYEMAKAFAGAMANAVEDGSMPPWLATESDECDPMLPFEGDLRLSDDEKALFRAWADADAPEGDADTATALPEAEPLFIESASAELTFTKAWAVDPGPDQFVCFVLDPGIDTMKWVTEIQLVPGNPEIAHHALIFQDVEGGLADGDDAFDCFNTPNAGGFLMHTWVPGGVPMVTPEGAAMPLYPNARLIVQMHYHPTSTQVVDQSTVQLVWQDEEPDWAAAQVLLGNNSRQDADGGGLQPGPNDSSGEAEFVIPAGVKDHTETIEYTQSFPLELPIFSVGTHMHYLGTDMLIEYIPADSDEGECMIQTRWDFNWQRVYNFDVPIDQMPTMGPGDGLRMRCTYDNTMDNPAVADALAEQGLSEPVDVVLGEETLDEMCLGLFGILIEPSLVGELF